MNATTNFRLTVAEHENCCSPAIRAANPAHRHRTANGLTALARFAGRGIAADDIAAIHTADEAYVLKK